jgi:hypothetical protein
MTLSEEILLQNRDQTNAFTPADSWVVCHVTLSKSDDEILYYTPHSRLYR